MLSANVEEEPLLTKQGAACEQIIAHPLLQQQLASISQPLGKSKTNLKHNAKIKSTKLGFTFNNRQRWVLQQSEQLSASFGYQT